MGILLLAMFLQRSSFLGHNVINYYSVRTRGTGPKVEVSSLMWQQAELLDQSVTTRFFFLPEI